MCNLGSGEAVGCGKRRVLTTLVRSPSVAPNRVGVKTERAQDSLRVRIGIERVNHKSEWIHRGIRLCVHCVDGSYSQVTGGPLTRPGETSQRHRGSMSGRRTIAPKTPNACLRNPPIGGWQQTSLYVGEGSHDSEKANRREGCVENDRVVHKGLGGVSGIGSTGHVIRSPRKTAPLLNE